jgi:hypothetical protein
MPVFPAQWQEAVLLEAFRLTLTQNADFSEGPLWQETLLLLGAMPE